MNPRLLLMLVALSGASGAFTPANGQDASRVAPAQSGASAVRAGSAFSDYQRFQEPALRPWRQANQEVADNPGMGSMGSMPNMPGMNMPGMNAPAAGAKPAAAGGHSMAGMDMPGMPSTKPGAAQGTMNMPRMGSPPRGTSSSQRPSNIASAMPEMTGSAMSGMPADHNMGTMQGQRPARASSKTAGAGGAGASGAPGGMAAMPGMSDKGAMGAMRGGSAATTGKDAASKQPMAAGGHVDAPGAHGKPAGGAMASMPGMSGAAAGGSKAEAGAPHGSGSAERSMGAMPGMGGKGGMEGKAGMGGMEGKSGEPDKARLSGTGTVKVVDKAAARVKLTHDPIAAAGWPGMTIVFRLSDAALADRVQAGDKVSFILSQSASGYVISELQKGPPSPVAKQSK